jgi:hypothetical protein
MRQSAEDRGHRSDRRRLRPALYSGAREGRSPIDLQRTNKTRISERASGANRGSRDRLTGQPQERQHSAARRAGRGTDCPRRATQERLHVSLVSILHS